MPELLRDVPPAEWNRAAEAYAELGALLEGRFMNSENGCLFGEEVPLIFVQVLKTVQSEPVVDIDASISVVDRETRDVKRLNARMCWNQETLSWRSVTGDQFIEAMHGRVLKHDGERPDHVRQFAWERRDSPSFLSAHPPEP